MPCPNTITNLLRKLDPDHLDRIIGAWLADRHPDGWEHLALDGKRLRGSRDGEVPGTHLLAAYAPGVSAVVAQMTVEATTNEHKAALRLLDVLPPLGGTVITGDAMFTQPDVCAAVQQKGGDYILNAKSNPSTLRADVEAAFTAAEGGFSPGLPRQWDRDAGTADEWSKGHGRAERRTMTSTTWLNEYLTRWPGVQQVSRLTRTRRIGGKTAVEVVYGISSVSPVAAPPEALLG